MSTMPATQAGIQRRQFVRCCEPQPIHKRRQRPRADRLPDEAIDTENLEKLAAGVGTIYVLGTQLYTNEGREIIKIGTTGNVEARINQLYTTGVPFRFRIIKTVETKNYAELEQALHSLLDPYRINRSREFLTERCLPHVEQIITLHAGIQQNAQS
jgi:T5orf172 domain